MLLPLSAWPDRIAEAINRAAAAHDVSRLDWDANLRCQPHAEVSAFSEWAHWTRRGLFAYAVDSSLDVFTALLSFHHNTASSCPAASLPAELYSWRYDPAALTPAFALRVNLSAPGETLMDFFGQRDHVTGIWLGKSWPLQQKITSSVDSSSARPIVAVNEAAG
ncbi:hypothetical protein SAMN05661093_11030 [Kibdelosporangium aridum]|uniref:Uncharacterized protein n=2 Tax=Kibdelosporangium aridum TaxID=2030 RepID=A0A1W2FZX5_KIBAR|nr:hypothetical protein SAMN05661093_11030 [Kibdelosporangium aridum]